LRVLGASGSGKSTLLRCLNFMEMPGAGAIALDGRPVGRSDGRTVGWSGAAKPL
jgi:polar amino acid transport system ATP-binding protein